MVCRRKNDSSKGGSVRDMKVKKDSRPDDAVLLAVSAIEMGARKMGIPPAEMCRRLNAQGLIRNRLFAHYGVLHTQSRELVADDIVEALVNWEAGT